MSLIVYRDRQLSADTVGISTFPEPKFVRMDKIYIDKYLTFCLAFTGGEVDHTTLTIENTSLPIIKELIKLEGFSNGKFLVPGCIKDYAGTIVLMTADKVFVSSESHFVQISEKEPSFYGSGYSVAEMLHLCTPNLPIEEFFLKVSIKCSTMRSSKIQSVKMDDLEHFSTLRKMLKI